LAAEVDLWPAVVFSPGAFSETGGAMTVTVKAAISNIGTISTTEDIVVRFYDDSAAQIGSDQSISELDCCAGVESVEVTWPSVPAGAHTVQVRVDPLDAIAEGDESNNEATGIVLVATERTWIPLITRGWTTN
jgi:subtilase family serine protease